MAQPIRQVKSNEIAELDTFYNGGEGSGNFGHAGRPGKRGGSGNGQLQRAATAEGTSGKVGHFAGVQYVDEIDEKYSAKLSSAVDRIKEAKKKNRDYYPDMNDPARAQLDYAKEALARAKELVGKNVPDTAQKKIERLEKRIKELRDITGW